MRVLGSVASVLAAIRDEVEEQTSRIGQETKKRLDEVAAMNIEAPVANPERDSRIAEAHRQSSVRLVEQQWMARKKRIETREQWLARVVETGNQRLSTRPPAPELAERLAREALARLPDVPAQIVLPTSWSAPAIPPVSKAATVQDPSLFWGCLARTADGRIAFDNRLEPRSKRLEPIWRKSLLEIYEAP